MGHYKISRRFRRKGVLESRVVIFKIRTCTKHEKTHLTNAPSFGFFCRYCKDKDPFSIERMLGWVK